MAQLNMFGNQLSRLPEFSNLANGNESYESLAAKIKEMLRDPIQQKQFLPHLMVIMVLKMKLVIILIQLMVGLLRLFLVFITLHVRLE